LKQLKEEIRALLEDLLPLVDFDADFLFAGLSSLDVTAILMALSDKYGIRLDATDATPRNLKSIDSIVALVERKLQQL
jgi:acyl carrier protein